MKDPNRNDLCDCCDGPDARTPLPLFNRPGLPALVYRAGTYGTFLETMLTRLGQVTFQPDSNVPPPQNGETVPAHMLAAPTAFELPVSPVRPLAGLRTRASSDPGIALLDAWAVIADILTFYNERLANEGYLRTALERRSLVELARLVGYEPRPGLSASVYLSFTIDAANPVVTIPAETKVQSTPEQRPDGPNELPQTFETAEAIEARPTWNAIRPRLSQPQYIPQVAIQSDTPVYLKSPNPSLKENDPILLEFVSVDGSFDQHLYRILESRVLPIPTEPALNGNVVEKAKLHLIPWTEPIPERLQGKLEWIVLDILVYYRKSLIPLESSSAVKKILTVLYGPGVEQIVITHVTQDEGLDVQLLRFPPSSSSWKGYLSKPGALDEDMIEVISFEFNQTGESELTIGIPEELQGLNELELRLIGEDGARPAPVRFLNQTGFTFTPGVGAEKIALNAMITQIQAVRVQLDSRFNHLAGLAEAMMMELDLVRRAYEIQVAAPDKTGEEFPTYTQAEVLAYLKAIQDTTALIGELDRAARIQALLEPILAGELQDYQRHLAQSEAPISAQLAQARKNSFSGVLNSVRASPAAQPVNGTRLARSTRALFGAAADLGPRLLTRVSPRSSQLYAAWSSGVVPRAYARPGSVVLKKAYAMRVKAGVFGQQLAGKPRFGKVDVTGGGGEKVTQITHYDPFGFSDVWPDATGNSTNTLYLDREYDKIVPGSWVVIQRYDGLTSFQVTAVGTRTLAAFGVSVLVTVLTLDKPWTFKSTDESLEVQTRTLRNVRVYAQSEPLELVDEPVTLEVSGPMVELEGLYEGLQSGKWVVVEGERTDLPGTARVRGAELVMIANVVQDVQMVDEDTPLPGDRPHTFLQLARNGLAYRYKRDTVRVRANVVKATHGETHTQILGGGDASRSFQTFELLFRPLTYLPAPTADGVKAALQVRVNNVLWHEAPNIAELEPTDREYLVKIDEDGKTSVIFGDGHYGARLPTAPENVRARYRNGLGKAGNVRGGGINLLLSRPPGVKEVINPLAASGGADRESPEGIRRSAPLALKALDRLVSVQDYEDFCRIYAGIGKSRAIEIPAVGGFLVHITIAGDADIPIDPLDDLYRNLVEALRRLGDPHQPFRVALRERILPVISAGVHLQPDYAWEFVEPQIRNALLRLLSFEYRELGQDISSSEVIATIQGVPGVHYTDLDVLDSVDQARLESFLRLQGEQKGDDRLDLAASLNLRLRPRIPVALARPDRSNPLVNLPAQIAYLDEEIRDLLILKEIAT